MRQVVDERSGCSDFNPMKKDAKKLRIQSKKIRILFNITEFNDGGIESALIQWLRILDREFFDITLSVLFESPHWHSRFRAIVPPDVRVEILARREGLAYFQLRRRANRLSKVGRVMRDIFNTCVLRPYVASQIKSLASKHDVIVDFDLSLRRLAGRYGVAWLGINHFSYAPLGKRRRKARVLGSQFRLYDRIVVLTERMAEEACRIFGPRLRMPLVLPNVVDIEDIRARAQTCSDELRPCVSPYIVSVARLDETVKDHVTLLRAYAILVETHCIREHLVVVGSGPFYEELNALSHELKLQERVHFVGHQDNPYPFIAGASLHVLSSRSEGMPMVLLEGLALGKPIVATDCPAGPREILDSGQAGWLVPVGDAQAMAEAIASILADSTIQAMLARRAEQRAAYYGIEQSNKRFKAYIDAIFASRESESTRGSPFMR